VTPVPAIVTGNNADLIAQVGQLYIKPGDVVADVTYGSGRFWKKFPVTTVTFLPSDLVGAEGVLAADFRHLPYADGSIDVAVLDPPYTHHPGTRNGHVFPPTSTRYRNTESTTSLYNEGIMELYRDGMAEAVRVMRPAGAFLLVKCKDMVQRDVMCWSSATIYEFAWDLGLWPRDQFFLIPRNPAPNGRWKTQRHARGRPSILWVFEKPDADSMRHLRQAPPGSHGRIWWETHG
jgi:hypothetical protein